MICLSKYVYTMTMKEIEDELKIRGIRNRKGGEIPVNLIVDRVMEIQGKNNSILPCLHQQMSEVEKGINTFVNRIFSTGGAKTENHSIGWFSVLLFFVVLPPKPHSVCFQK